MSARDDLDIGIHMNSLRADLSEPGLSATLRSLVDLGYRRVILPPDPLSPAEVEAVVAAFEKVSLARIAMVGQSPDADVASDDPTIRRAGIASLRAGLAGAIAVGADQLNGVAYGIFGHPTTTHSRRRFIDAARAVGEVADEATAAGVTMTFEVVNRYETSMLNTADQAMDFVDASGSEGLRIHLDTYHMAIEEADISAAIGTALPKLTYLELGQSGRGFLSTGTVDLPRVVSVALADGYRGRWGVEAFSRPLLAPETADMLAIWRAPYANALEMAADAIEVIEAGWAAHAA